LASSPPITSPQIKGVWGRRPQRVQGRALAFPYFFSLSVLVTNAATLSWISFSEGACAYTM